MDLNHVPLSQDVILIHYINDIMLIGPNEQKVATIPDLLVRLFVYQSVENKPKKKFKGRQPW
jgi:hypothetical protein